MKRTGALALAMLIAACNSGSDSGRAGRPGNGAGLAAEGDAHDTAATLALAASGPGNCSARWDGQPATTQQVLDRSAAAVGQAIDRAGGIANLTEETLPALAVTAPADLAFACADSFLAPVRRAGVATLLLSVEGGPEAALADFTLSDIGAPPPSVVLAIGAGGRLTWNGEAVALGALAERVRQLSGAGAAEMEAPAGELEIRPAREATFGQVHAALRAVREGRIRAALLLPSVPPNRLPAPTAAPPPPPAPANQAAPRP
ncbi:MAG TPA: hypothetical protein VEC11_16745 [Allosphingosinicella sp.]|nr:hypothetical protein [Allosphingosinicella sp.]